MKSFTAPEASRTHVLQLDPGDLLLESIRAAIAERGIRNGAVVSGIGTLDRTTMHMVTTTTYPPVEVYPRWDGVAVELVSLQGVIADDAPHIHMTVSTTTGAVSGHLEEGCRVLYLAEVVVIEFVGLELTRVRNEQGQLKLVDAHG